MSPLPASHPDESPESLFAEYLARREAGEALDFDVFCRANSEHSVALRQLRDEWRREQAERRRSGERRAGAGSFAARLAKKYGEGADPEVSLDEGPGAAAGTSAPSVPSSAPTEELVKRLAQHGLKESRYKLEGEIARGGMGAILRVWDEDLRRHLAMKVILGKAESPSADGTPPVDSRQLARFLEEAQVTGQLDHPGIVPVHELGLDSDGRVYFTMKLVKGRDLKKIFDLVFAEKEGWNETRALGLMLRACEAMGYAHAKGVIHRDLKPANVMVGNFGEVYVMDWGLARVLDRKDTHDIRLKPEFSISMKPVATERREEREALPDSPLITMDGDVMGTPAYMSPEQARGEVEKLSARSDVYSLGAMLYHLIARQMPYVPPGERITNRTVLSRLLDGPPKPIHSIKSDVPAELAAICEKAISREAAERYPDTLALAEDLRAFLEHRVVKAYETGPVAELKKWIARNPGLAGASATAILILVVGLIATSTLFTKAKQEAARADAKAVEAKSNEELAKQNETRARQNEGLAKQSELVAKQKADDVLSLSAIQDLDDLIARADKLWPAYPENLTKYEDWLRDARALIDGRPADEAKAVRAKPGLAEHKAKLAELEARALPQTDEEKGAERAAHPRAEDLAKKRAKAEWMARMLGKSPWPSESETQAAVERLSPAPSGANAWNEIAWPLVDPDKEVFGDEVKALVCARRAVDGSVDAARYQVRDTLAWALFKLGRFDEALAQEKKALEEAPEKEKKSYEAFVKKLESAITGWRSPSGETRPPREKEWSDLASEVQELEKLVNARGEWSFADSEDRWWHVQLTKLITNLGAFADPKIGLFSSGTSKEHGWGIEKRAEFARTVDEQSVTGPEAVKRWGEAIASIRDEKQCPKYGGFVLTPQLGLLPIVIDKDSGLWEFAHLQSGEPAVRGADGKLVLKEEMGLVLVLIPGATFKMGAQSTDPTEANYDPESASNEQPVHEVTLAPYFLSKYEMTQAQWERFVGSNPSYYRAGNRSAKTSITSLHPVEQVSWDDCTQTLERLGLALPAEAQWERGCRAGTSTAWNSGDSVESLAGYANIADEGSADAFSKGWSFEPGFRDGFDVHAPVGSLRPNAFGLHDMHGNVWEWCGDGYGDYDLPVHAGDGERLVTDPRIRVLRGGGFSSTAVLARSALRYYYSPEYRINALGVRPTRSITP